MVDDLSSVIAQGGFEPLRDPKKLMSVESGPGGRKLIWRVGEGEDYVVNLRADALWLMVHPDESSVPQVSPAARPE